MKLGRQSLTLIWRGVVHQIMILCRNVEVWSILYHYYVQFFDGKMTNVCEPHKSTFLMDSNVFTPGLPSGDQRGRGTPAAQ